jgi:hypothetical protein
VIVEEALSEDTLRKVCDRAARDPGFRARLIKNPHIGIKDAAGVLVSTMLRIKFVEKDPDVDVMVVLPDLTGDASAHRDHAQRVPPQAHDAAPPVATVLETVVTEDEVRRTPIVGDREALIRACVEWAAPDGLVLEFGVFQGESLRLLRDVFGPPVIGYDSFTGLPQPWERSPGHALPAGYFRCRPPIIDGAELVIGDFADTVAPDLAMRARPIRLAHIDCDLYSSCAAVLGALRPWLRDGTILLFDELVGFETSAYRNWRQGEWRALQESGIRCRPLGRTGHSQCALQIRGFH